MSKLLDLLLPNPCVLCLKSGATLCYECQEIFPIVLRKIEIEEVEGFAFSSYGEKSSLLVNSIKETGLTSLIPAVASLISAHWPDELARPVFVPIPSTPRNLKRRGFSHTHLLAQSLSKRLNHARVLPLLASSGNRLDQVGLGQSERRENLRGAFRVLPHRAINGPLVLLDDVYTSGATMGEAIRTMRDSGLKVASFCVFTEASPRVHRI